MSNPLPVVTNGNGSWDETDDSCTSFSAFMHPANSSHDPYIADEFAVPPPEYSAVFHHDQSRDEVNHSWVETDEHNGASLSDFMREAGSKYSIVDPSSLKEMPGHTEFARRDRSSNGNGPTTKKTRNLRIPQTVKQLRLWDTLTVPETATIYDAGCMMAAHSADVILLTDSNVLLSGILTQKDIVKRFIASGIDLVNTPVSKVMTKNPAFVLSDNRVNEAVEKMVGGGVKQLPVIENGAVIGLVRLEKCLLHFKSKGMAMYSYTRFTEHRMNIDHESEVGDRSYTVKQLGLPKALCLPETVTIYEACCRMASTRADALILLDSNTVLSGILTNKDIISKVIASGINFMDTPVLEVMLKNPVSVSSDTLAVEALEKMLQGEVTHLPVVENGEVIALLDMLICLICVYGGGGSPGVKDKVVAAGFEAAGKQSSFDIWEY